MTDFELALHLAVQNEDLSMVKLLIAFGVDIEAKCNFLQSPLYDAIYFLEKKDIFEELIANGADVTVKTPDGNSLLHYAIEKDKYDFVKIIMESGPFLMKMKDQDGKTPIELAFSKKKMKVLKSMMFFANTKRFT